MGVKHTVRGAKMGAKLGQAGAKRTMKGAKPRAKLGQARAKPRARYCPAETWTFSGRPRPGPHRGRSCWLPAGTPDVAGVSGGGLRTSLPAGCWK